MDNVPSYRKTLSRDLRERLERQREKYPEAPPEFNLYSPLLDPPK